MGKGVNSSCLFISDLVSLDLHVVLSFICVFFRRFFRGGGIVLVSVLHVHVSLPLTL